MEASLPQLILPIKIGRSSERLTSLGGLGVVEELARAVGLWEVTTELPRGGVRLRRERTSRRIHGSLILNRNESRAAAH